MAMQETNPKQKRPERRAELSGFRADAGADRGRPISLFSGRGLKRAAAAVLFSAVFAAGAAAEGLRNITALNVDYFFDNMYQITSEDVFLARLSKAFSLLFKISRYDRPDFYEHVFYAGPVVNFTDEWYMELTYGLGLDSGLRIEHRGELNLTYETEAVVLGLGARGSYFPDTGYFYVIPSLNVKFRPLTWMAVFSKLFLSWDSLNFFSGSVWGELYWITGDTVTIRTGGTLSWSGVLGYSLLAGIDIRFSPAVLLRYYFQFLSNTVDYSVAPAPEALGIQNGLILDLKF